MKQLQSLFLVLILAACSSVTFRAARPTDEVEEPLVQTCVVRADCPKNLCRFDAPHLCYEKEEAPQAFRDSQSEVSPLPRTASSSTT